MVSLRGLACQSRLQAVSREPCLEVRCHGNIRVLAVTEASMRTVVSTRTSFRLYSDGESWTGLFYSPWRHAAALTGLASWSIRSAGAITAILIKYALLQAV